MLERILNSLISLGVGYLGNPFKKGKSQEEISALPKNFTTEKIIKEINLTINNLENALQVQKKTQQEKDYWKAQAQQLQQQINPSQCTPNSPCSCPDYQEIKQQRDTAHQEKEQKEQQIIQQINQSLNLGLKEPNLEQTITRIQELINKPLETIYSEFSNGELEQELNQANQTIINLEKELKENNTPFGEDLEVIKELELTSLEELFKQTVDNMVRQEIQQATSYQQVVSTRQAFIQKHLGKQQNIQSLPAIVQSPNELTQQPNQERIILISLLMVSLLSVGGLLMKLKSKKEK